MQSHLDSDCESCRRSFEFFRLLGEAGAASAFEVPLRVLERARDIMTSEEWTAQLRVLAAELVSWTSLESRPSGVRSLSRETSAGPGRRFLYRAGDYTIDLNLQGDIIGQISNSNDEREKFDGVPVWLEAGGRVIARTTANVFGEFLLEHPARREGMVLRLVLRDAGCTIEIPLRVRDSG